MPIDSAANLIFNISADSSEAEGNIKRFRTLLTKDLDDIKAEFGSWSSKVFGDLSTVKGGLLGVTAALAAGVVAAAAAAVEAAGKYREFVSEIGRGVKVTGVAAETMSGLHYAANATGTGYDALVTGIARFESEVVKANGSTENQIALARRLGVSREAVAAGEKNIIPLLEATMDRFRGLASGTERAALARELFSRNGTELLGFLRLGAEGLRKMTEEAERLGLVVTAKDIAAVKEFKAVTRELKEEQEAMAVTFGRVVQPAITGFYVMMLGLADTLRDARAYSAGFLATWVSNSMAAAQRIQDLMHSMKAVGDQSLDNTEHIKKETHEWYGFSTVLDQVRGKLAGTQGDEAKAAQELAHIGMEASKAQAEFRKLVKEGALSAETIARESKDMALLPARMAALGQALWKEILEKQEKEREKLRLSQDAAGEDLRQRINATRDRSFAEQETAWGIEIEKLRTKLAKEKLLTAENEAALVELRASGLAKIQREQTDAFTAELMALQTHLAQMVVAQMTARERLSYQYDADLVKYSEVEEAKALLTAKSETERAIISAQFAANRDALLQRYGLDLVALQNSQGWDGVFGARFAAGLKRNEALLREWATANKQSTMLVRASLEGLKEAGQDAFAGLAQGMGANIAHAVIYEQSIGKAMRAALAATLESIAAESLVNAIYCTALGFMRLAQHDYPAAGQAFTAAAIWGGVGGAAMLAGRLVAPKDEKAAGAAGGSSAAAGKGVGDTGDAVGAGGPKNTLIVQFHGPVYGGQRGIDELCAAISDAVNNRDTRLVASGTTSSQVVRR